MSDLHPNRETKRKVGRGKSSKAIPLDPVFAAEMRAIQEARHDEFVGDFHERWAERLKKPTTLRLPR